MARILPKKKILYLRLVFVFSGITLLTLLSVWGTNHENNSSKSMMNQSMGRMMQTMHSQNIKVNDLIFQDEAAEQVTGGTPQHGSTQSHLQIGHYLTTLVIVFLVPFILAGSVFLLVVWFK